MSSTEEETSEQLVAGGVTRALALMGRAPAEPIREQTRFNDDLGLDSFDMMELLLKLEDDLRGSFDSKELMAVETVADLARAFRPAGA